MNTGNNSLNIQPVRPQDLSQRDFERLNEVSQDLWATEAGLGELAQCNHCGKMHSKEEVFAGIPKELFQKTVAEILKELAMDQILCHSCGKDTHMIYGPENVELIKQRVLKSVDSFLILCTDGQEKIVGFEEGYIDNLQNIFDRDLHYHYREVGVKEIWDRVSQVLGYLPDNMLIFSSIGLLEPQRNFANLFELLNQFSRAIPEDYIDMPGITELDKDNVIHRMSASLNTGISLGINESPVLRKKITNVGAKYNSNLIVYQDPVKIYKENFTNGMRNFLRMSKGSKTIQKQVPVLSDTTLA